MSEYCDDDRCRGCYAADGAEVLLKAEIPVLTLKKNRHASAAFFNVPPHMVKGSRFDVRVYGSNNISPLMEKAAGSLLRMLSGTGIEISSGRLVACHTQDNAVLVIVENPDDEHDLTTLIEIGNSSSLTGEPETNRNIALLEKTRTSRTYRVALPKGELLTMLFKKK